MRVTEFLQATEIDSLNRRLRRSQHYGPALQEILRVQAATVWRHVKMTVTQSALLMLAL